KQPQSAVPPGSGRSGPDRSYWVVRVEIANLDQEFRTIVDGLLDLRLAVL
ncbi:hypothetical protein BHE74_00046551, partial [Ensete ventricosum]